MYENIISVSSFSTQLSIDKITCEISISTDLNSRTTNYINNFINGDLIIKFNNEFILLNSAKMIIIHTNNSGFISHCIIRISDIKNITRNIKIKNIIDI